jgi:SAM-dependent methyltransferase
VHVAPGARRERAEALDAAGHYDRYVVPFTEPYARALMAALSSAIPRRVLDHGAGTGTVTHAVLAQFPHARLTALDPSAAMLNRLVDRLDDSDRGRVEIIRGTAADLRATDRFDAIVSQLAFMFVPDPEADLRLLRGHAEPGAPLVVCVLGGRDDVVAFDLYWTAAARVDPGFAGSDEYPHFRFGDPTELIAATGRAGWANVRCEKVVSHREVSVDELWDWLSGAMPLRRRGTGGVAAIDPPTRQRLRAELINAAATFSVGSDLIRLPMHGWCLRASAT